MFVLLGLDFVKSTIKNGGEFGFNAGLYFLGDAVRREICRHMYMAEPGAIDVLIEVCAGFYARVGFRYVRLRSKDEFFLSAAPALTPMPGLH